MTGEVKKKRVATDMTQGNPAKLICLFALPLLFGNVLQQLYNMVDSIVVGNLWEMLPWPPWEPAFR